MKDTDFEGISRLLKKLETSAGQWVVSDTIDWSWDGEVLTLYRISRPGEHRVKQLNTTNATPEKCRELWEQFLISVVAQ